MLDKLRESQAPALDVSKRGHVRAEVKAVINEWLLDFNEERVSEQTGVSVTRIRRIIRSKKTQSYISARLVPEEILVDHGRRRLMEELLKDALAPDASKNRTEARRILGRKILPEYKRVEHKHRFVVEVPERAESTEAWAAKNLPPSEDAAFEIVDD